MSNISTKTEEKTRKNHFLCRISQQRRNKISIAKRLSSVEEFCRNIGLRLDHIIITPDNLEKYQDVKITVQNEKLTESFKTLQLLRAYILLILISVIGSPLFGPANSIMLFALLLGLKSVVLVLEKIGKVFYFLFG